MTNTPTTPAQAIQSKFSPIKLIHRYPDGSQDFSCPNCQDIIHQQPNVFYGRCPACQLTLMTYYPAPHQQAFHCSPAPYRLLIGGFGPLPISQLIPTPNGNIPLKAIQKGDEVFGSNGCPITVTDTQDFSKRQLLRLTFSDGATIKCDKNHLWTVHTTDDKAKTHTATLTAQQLYTLFQQNKNFIGGSFRRMRLPITSPVQYSLFKLNTNPYVLGALIADGSLIHTISYTKHESKILSFMRSQVNYSYSSKTRLLIPRKTNPTLYEDLKNLGLLGKKSKDKFLDTHLITMSPQDRLLLLQGLMDGDGSPVHYSRVNTLWKYTTSSFLLAKGVRSLVCSLGGVAKIFPIPRDKTYQVHFTINQNPFLFSCWTDKWEQSYSSSKVNRFQRYIHSITLTDEWEEVKCLTVDSKDHLYICDTDSFILTHNSGKTTAGVAELARHILSTPKGKTLLTANTITQVRETALLELDKFLPPWFIKVRLKTPTPYIKLFNEHEIIVYPSDDEQKIRSLNLTAFYIEEASNVPHSIFTQLRARLRNTSAVQYDEQGKQIGSSFCGIIATNPDESWIRKDFLLKSSSILTSPSIDPNTYMNVRVSLPLRSFHSFISSSRDNPYLPSGYIASLCEGQSHTWVRKYIDCYLDVKEGAVYPEFKDCLIEPFVIPTSWKRIFGFDKGYNDATVLVCGAIDPTTQIIYIYDEYYQRERPISYHAKFIAPLIQPYSLLLPVQADPSVRNRNELTGASYQDYFMSLSNIWLECANNDIDAGIEKLRDYMYLGKIKIFNTLDNLKAEANEYVYKIKDQVSTDKPVDKNNHLMDALRYMISPLPNSAKGFDRAYINNIQLERQINSVLPMQNHNNNVIIGLEQNSDYYFSGGNLWNNKK